MADRMQWLSQSDYSICISALVLLILDRNTELARAVDVMMARANEIYVLLIKVVSFFRYSVF